MNYAFTIDEKINSKKLIEELASASPFIPHFNNQGNFKFNVIPATNPTALHTIQESKVIDFTFKRTKVENVKTKVEVKYKWDYARGEFGESVVASLGNGSVNLDDDATASDYSAVFNYYKLESDHSQSTLVVDDHRGKYIRDSATAKNLANFLLDYHMNQHLILSVKLPLSVGLVMEVGDIVEFDSLLGGIRPYGIDYSSNAQASLNNQNLFPKFIIINTNKTLEMVTIECEQLHKLMQVDHLYDEEGTYDLANADTSYQAQIFGCINEDANNFNPEATVDDGSCTFNHVHVCLVGQNTDQYGQEPTSDSVTDPSDPLDQYYNYPTEHLINDSSKCVFDPPVEGCMNDDVDGQGTPATNYDPDANADDGSCYLQWGGCEIWNATNVVNVPVIASGGNVNCTFPINDYVFFKSDITNREYFNLMHLIKPLNEASGFVQYYTTWPIANIIKIKMIFSNIGFDLNYLIRMKYFSETGWQFNSYLYWVSASGATTEYETFQFNQDNNNFSFLNIDDFTDSPHIIPEEMFVANNVNFHSPNSGDICYVIATHSESTTDVFRRLKYQDGGEEGIHDKIPNHEHYIVSDSSP